MKDELREVYIKVRMSKYGFGNHWVFCKPVGGYVDLQTATLLPEPEKPVEKIEFLDVVCSLIDSGCSDSTLALNEIARVKNKLNELITAFNLKGK